MFSHRFHRFTQNFLAEKNSVKYVDSVGDIHALTSVRICEICGSFFNCKLRVDSVGSIRALTSVRICEICGSFFNCKLRVKSVEVFSTTNLEWILWEFFNYKLQKSECYRNLCLFLNKVDT